MVPLAEALVRWGMPDRALHDGTLASND